VDFRVLAEALAISLAGTFLITLRKKISGTRSSDVMNAGTAVAVIVFVVLVLGAFLYALETLPW